MPTAQYPLISISTAVMHIGRSERLHDWRGTHHGLLEHEDGHYRRLFDHQDGNFVSLAAE